MKIIAHIESAFPTKFGIPRQSGLCNELISKIVFEPEYRVKEAFRGLEEFSHIWLIWQFSESVRDEWSPTVRPPKLGGNKRVGVFATRSPFRPNPIGLSSVEIAKIDLDSENGPVIYIKGADLMDGTPIYDIKPYLPYCDSHPTAGSGFAPAPEEELADVSISDKVLEKLPKELHNALFEVLKNDPRPGYNHNEQKSFGFGFSGYEITFIGDGKNITVTDIVKSAD